MLQFPKEWYPDRLHDKASIFSTLALSFRSSTCTRQEKFLVSSLTVSWFSPNQSPFSFRLFVMISVGMVPVNWLVASAKPAFKVTAKISVAKRLARTRQTRSLTQRGNGPKFCWSIGGCNCSQFNIFSFDERSSNNVYSPVGIAPVRPHSHNSKAPNFKRKEVSMTP
jgi:hypothetical protein